MSLFMLPRVRKISVESCSQPEERIPRGKSADIAWKIFAMLALLICGLNSALSTQEDTKLPTIREIEQAWKQREVRITTLECEWTEQEFVPAHSRSAQESPSLRRVTVPKEDLEFTNRCMLKIGTDKRYRYESDGKRLINRIQQYADCHFVAATDGRQAKSLRGEDQTGEQRYAPLGFIRQNEELFELLDLGNGGALLIYCRPSAKEVRFYCALDSARVRGSEVINGRSCVLVEHGQKPRITQLYFDLERDYVPVRLVRWSESPKSNSPFEVMRFDLEYEVVRDGEVQLSAWTAESYEAADEPIYRGVASVVRFEINPAIPDSEFQLEFPPGTKVINEREKEGSSRSSAR
jgi:hypothetical protein